MAFNPLGFASGLVSAAMPLVAAKAGVGKNTTNVTDFGRTSQYNPDAFQYGGRAGAADETANRFAGLAGDAQNRQAAQAAVVNPNYGRANDWDAQGQYARQAQGNAANLMMNRATGLTPSIAQMQGQRDMQQAAAAQASAAAGARGAAGLAMAQQNAANNTATMQSAISNQAQINAANERMQAEQAAYGAFSGMRAGDAQAQGLAAQQAQYAAQIGAQQNQYNAQLQAQQRAQNDAYSLGLYNQEAGVRNAQLTGGMNNQAMLSNSFGQGQGQRIGVGAYNADREYQYYDQFGKGLTGAMSAGGFGGGAPGGGAAGGGGTPPLAASTTGVSSGVAAPPNPNMVGIPAPGSDDRMKFGITPLGLLGMGGGGGGPSSGPAAASYDALNSDNSMNVMGSLQAHSDAATRYGSDPTGGMQGGLLSDDKAKLRAVYLQGLADAGSEAPRAYPGLGAGEDLVVGRDGARIRQAGFAGLQTSGSALTNREKAARISEEAAAADDDGGLLTSPVPLPVRGLASLLNSGRAQLERHAGLGVESSAPRTGYEASPDDPGYDEERRFAERYGGADSIRRAPGAPADPVTQQFARGLAPISFEYKPGLGPSGRQTGVRAQQAETQPITASMITRRPDGLRQIDPAMGLSTALAAAGNANQKLAQHDEQLRGLLALAARKEGY